MRNYNTSRCKICGKRFRDSTNEEGESIVYCSFKCSVISRRKVYLVFSILSILLAIIVQIIYYFTVQSIELIVTFTIFYIISCPFITLALWGFIAHRRRNDRQDTLDTERKEYTNSLDVEEINIQPFEYKKKSKIDICMICKLNIHKQEIVYQCLKCNSYFHKRHLEDWLRCKSECPVCETLFRVEIKNSDE